METQDWGGAVAIVGLSGRFPQAATPDELWDNLVSGACAIRTVSDEELDRAGVDPGLAAGRDYVRAAAPVDGIEDVDAAFFGWSPREAALTNPQHRLFLECCWEALESAGYDPYRAPGVVAVFGGSQFPTYLENNIATRPELIAEVGRIAIGIGNNPDSLPNTVSYKLDLHGPAVAVQAFCATSLVAVHLACQSVLTHESDLALAGGVSVEVPQTGGYRYEEGGMFAPDGVVRTFDARAFGSCTGNGAGVVALKRMADALADGDHVHAVIVGSAVNNDGGERAGYFAPNVDGQADVIADALAVAAVDPDDIDYVECHGTGTLLGDAVELAAMNRVFGGTRRPPGSCFLTSAKPNIGHLEAASGIAGLIKTAKAIEHAAVTPSINFETPNAALDLDAGPFRIVTQPTPWPRRDRPRRAGVSSFGLGGTNCHVVVQEPPPTARSREPVAGPHLLVLSARTPTALDAFAERLAQHLADHDELALADVAATLQSSRTGFNHRLSVACDDRADAIRALRDRGRRRTSHQTRRDRPVELRVPPPAAWHREAAAALAAVEPDVRDALDACPSALAAGPGAAGAAG
ncbi:MAG TPA: polyketide synthase, partial [Solirubrobacteraceae bacterium]|nr:polyketide synthase [Solirubrobacteraceae bacterium]